MSFTWEEKWPNHWVLRCDNFVLSVFKHREIGGDGLASRWTACMESSVVGFRQTLDDRSLTVEQAQAKALDIAGNSITDAMQKIQQIREALAKQDAAKEGEG